MIVVATADFEVYHDVVEALRERQLSFTTIEPEAPLPDGTTAVIMSQDETREASVPVIHAERGGGRAAVDAALGEIGGRDGQVVVGIDPGTRPGIAVFVAETLVAAFQVPLDEAAAVVKEEIADAADPVVRIGDGARLRGSRLIDALEGVRIELVDETGTTPYLGSGARGMGDVLAAVNIAGRSGDPIDGRTVEPTEGELRVIQDRSRRVSEANRTIPVDLARAVAVGDLTLEEALAAHRSDEESTEE